MRQIFFKLWPLNRSVTGNGLRQSLIIIKRFIGKLNIVHTATGYKAFDWKVPQEWIIKDAYILTPELKKICNFKKNNLHVLNYSKPINKKLSLKKLKKNLYTIKNLPNAIPYVTSYYKKNWGFCISHNEFKKLKEGTYKAVINSKFIEGKTSYGIFFKKGSDKREIFFSTNICHPSLANNELSGPIVLSYICKWLKNKKTKYSYKILFTPETIGSIVFIKKNFNKLKKNVIVGYNISCIGDKGNFSFLPSRNETSLSNRIILNLFKKFQIQFKKYTWLDRGSDERQYCSPYIDLPIASIMRSKYDEYKEYHTSLDKFNKVVTIKSLKESVNIIKKLINNIEKTVIPKTNKECEPFMSKYNLYPPISDKNQKYKTREIMNIISYCDNNHSVDDIVSKTKIEKSKILKYLKILERKKIIHI